MVSLQGFLWLPGWVDQPKWGSELILRNGNILMYTWIMCIMYWELSVIVNTTWFLVCPTGLRDRPGRPSPKKTHTHMWPVAASEVKKTSGCVFLCKALFLQPESIDIKGVKGPALISSDIGTYKQGNLWKQEGYWAAHYSYCHPILILLNLARMRDDPLYRDAIRAAILSRTIVIFFPIQRAATRQNHSLNVSLSR